MDSRRGTTLLAASFRRGCRTVQRGDAVISYYDSRITADYRHNVIGFETLCRRTNIGRHRIAVVIAVVGDDRVGCDGCGRTVTLENLTTVTMPDGQRVACCPDCEPHARASARKGGSLDQRRDTCDGCTGTFPVADLETVVLDDGTVLTCCPSCATEAPTATCDDASAPDAGGATDAGPATDSEPADTDRYRCTQCHDQLAEEPFRVTTVDERTERLCVECKATAEDRGIVAAVDMRKTRAREILGVAPDVTDDELRAVYHDQIKRAHPDRKSGSRAAFQLVTEAYERLRDDE